jgi:hypothetical protein
MEKNKQGPLPAPKAHAAQELIKARVRPSNRYGGVEAGGIVNVPPSELKRVPHALIALEDEQREMEEASKPKAPSSGTVLFRGLKASRLAAAKAAEESRAIQVRKQMETLGVQLAEPKGKQG